jgi:hypothetical protein
VDASSPESSGSRHSLSPLPAFALVPRRLGEEVLTGHSVGCVAVGSRVPEQASAAVGLLDVLLDDREAQRRHARAPRLGVAMTASGSALYSMYAVPWFRPPSTASRPWRTLRCSRVLLSFPRVEIIHSCHDGRVISAGMSGWTRRSTGSNARSSRMARSTDFPCPLASRGNDVEPAATREDRRLATL